MRTGRRFLLAALVIAAIGGAAGVIESWSSRMALAQPVALEDHWRYHEGRWSYWSAADRLWYYTDGIHWFFYDGRAWAPYHFDRHFGRKGFERATYKPPGEGVKYHVPEHKVWVP